MNLNQIGLPTQDIAASVAFYRKLGFSAIVNTPEYARFRSVTGNATFSLLKTSRQVPSGITVYFEVSDVDTVVGRLRTDGVQFIEGPATQPWGWREARLQDPSGNNLCVYHAGELRLHPKN